MPQRRVLHASSTENFCHHSKSRHFHCNYLSRQKGEIEGGVFLVVASNGRLGAFTGHLVRFIVAPDQFDRSRYTNNDHLYFWNCFSYVYCSPFRHQDIQLERSGQNLAQKLSLIEAERDREK
jgi:hypothetical protein